ncbi:hypothetical protein [Allomesorhizobium alhagi]|jgi:hypothetical protein|uniref:Uncharacterized protein n=1 Tax=Mesorhizobium alhagi CCNWXJ12-2 TaxID=1107882 RepID=H0HT42_9HYPH|nr:hypothetical protein [Mesorhizobium alhagi]EHK56088.1 hypothetical protein MAXJ12_16666 [Mesorhizobium alhagi CCNWXJ12-2]
MLIIWLGALLFVIGIVLLAGQAIYRGRMSEPGPAGLGSRNTLEPAHRGVRFMGLGSNWPGLVLVALGAILLIFGGYF